MARLRRSEEDILLSESAFDRLGTIERYSYELAFHE